MKKATDEKYVVMKAKEWSEFCAQLRRDGWPGALEEPSAIEDAVVLRTKDVFAGPALHLYAQTVFTAARIIEHLAPEGSKLDVEATALLAIADYFHERAVEADEVAGTALVIPS